MIPVENDYEEIKRKDRTNIQKILREQIDRTHTSAFMPALESGRKSYR